MKLSQSHENRRTVPGNKESNRKEKGEKKDGEGIKEKYVQNIQCIYT